MRSGKQVRTLRVGDAIVLDSAQVWRNEEAIYVGELTPAPSAANVSSRQPGRVAAPATDWVQQFFFPFAPRDADILAVGIDENNYARCQSSR